MRVTSVLVTPYAWCVRLPDGRRGASMGGEDVYLRGADGVRLHAVQAGTGQLVVLLHGFPQFWYLWRRQIEPLSELFHVVAPDTRGINLSSGPPDLNAYRPDR